MKHAKPFSVWQLLIGLLAVVSLSWPAASQEFDVLIYGATPSGIAAAVAAGKSGRSVVLVEPTSRIGGMVTSGLSHSDFHSFESLSGAFLDFSQRVESHYVTTFGKDSPQARDSFRGTFGEPKVNLSIFEQMLAEVPSVSVRKQLLLQSVVVTSVGDRKRITSAAFVRDRTNAIEFFAKMFIDASYEGDLMAKAGVPWRVGREAREEYAESLAPEKADGQLQAYNFRFVMTRESANRVSPVAPPGYRRDDFVGVLTALDSGRIKRIFDYPRDCIFKAQTPPLPNGKYDINDVSGGLVRLSLPGENLGWPDGPASTRAKIHANHLRDEIGLLYFLQSDAAVPAKFRDEAQQWGWCRDEFSDSGHLPPQLYVREARRMVGVHVFTQRDTQHAPADARAVLHQNAIAMGDYGNNCHGTVHEGPRFGGKHVGEFYNPVPPYQIPYGVLLAREFDNLLVPVAASSSHIGFCALRLEPIWMSLGQAAGHAATLAIEHSGTVQQVNIPLLQHRLHADKSATIYVSDVLPGSVDFALVQWWGTLGGLHGLAPMPAKSGQRGKNIHGQYFEANPGHVAELDQPLSRELAESWSGIAKQFVGTSEKLPPVDNQTTRRQFIHAAFEMSEHPARAHNKLK